MNREQRKRIAKQGITTAELHHMEKEIGLNAMKFTIEAYSAALAVVLFGYDNVTEDMSKEILDQTAEHFDIIMKDYPKLEQYKKQLLEEHNFALFPQGGDKQ